MKNEEVTTTTENHVELVKTASPINVDKMITDLKTMKEGIEITGSYHKWTDGEKLRCWVVGTTTMESLNPVEKEEGTLSVAIKLLTEDKKIIITAASVIVSSLEKFARDADENNNYTPYLIECTGEIAQKGKQAYKTFKIYPLS